MIVCIVNYRGSRRIKGDLVIVQQVSVGVSKRAALRDIAAVYGVVTHLYLAKRGTVGGSVKALSVKNVPIGVVIIRGLGSSVPRNAHGTLGRACLKPRNNTCSCFCTIVHTHRLAPGCTFVS